MRAVEERLTHASIPTMIALLALANECLRITGLEILSPRGLNVHHGIVAPAWRMIWTEGTVNTTCTSWLMKTIVER
jgi:hypothetical protein